MEHHVIELRVGQLGDQQLVTIGLVMHLNPEPIGGIGDAKGGFASGPVLPGGFWKSANLGQCGVGTGVFPVLEVALNRCARDHRNRAGIRVDRLEHAQGQHQNKDTQSIAEDHEQ